jgi:hypothetical protein
MLLQEDPSLLAQQKDHVEEKLENDVRQRLPHQAEILGLSCPGVYLASPNSPSRISTYRRRYRRFSPRNRGNRGRHAFLAPPKSSATRSRSRLGTDRSEPAPDALETVWETGTYRQFDPIPEVGPRSSTFQDFLESPWRTKETFREEDCNGYGPS